MIQLENMTKTPEDQTLAKAKGAVERLEGVLESDFLRVLQDLSLWQESQALGARLREEFTHLGILGIGGSSLGPKVIEQCLGSDRRLVVCENVDPIALERKWGELDLQKTHWLVISKSGKTLETLSQLTLLRDSLFRSGLELRRHVTVISDPGLNPLTQWAEENQIRKMTIPPKVGGRYSVFTPVGLVPAAFLGHSAESFRAGAVWVSQQKELLNNLVAQTLESFSRGEWITAFWFYSDEMAPFGAWIQQLWAESLGKKQDRSGKPAPRVSTPLSLIGASDQHSILQQVMEGAKDKFVWFFSHRSAESSGRALHNLIGLPPFLEGVKLGRVLSAERRATQNALKAEGIHSLTVSVSDMDAATLGGLFMLFELTVVGVAEALNINAFDQPGVELGKRLAYEILQNER